LSVCNVSIRRAESSLSRELLTEIFAVKADQQDTT
jgi:hypothetical protein